MNPRKEECCTPTPSPFSERWCISDCAVACHVDCLAREPDTPPRARFLAMTYNYHPRWGEMERRKRWLRSSLAQVLHSILQPFSLPMEVCELIAGFCGVRAWAAEMSRAWWEQQSAISSTPVTPDHAFYLDKQVWARHVELEGVRYIACLTNEPGDQRESFSLVYSPTLGEVADDTLCLAEEYLGIRDVYFVSSAALPDLQHKQGPGVWWKTFTLLPGSYFQVGNDGTRVRGLYQLFNPDRSDMNLNDVDSDRMEAFEHPVLMDRVWWHQIFPPEYGMYMTSFVCNDPATTAYSVCCDDRPYTIRAHADGERNLTFYTAEARPERHAAVWLYMPINPDEKVTEVWVRDWENRAPRIDDAVFVLRTNQQRTLFMGAHPTRRPRATDDTYYYTRVYQASEAPGRIYFDVSYKGIHQLALESPLPPQPAAGQPPLPRPKSKCPGNHKDENYFYTSAVLDGVAEITPCRTELGIIGLLLQYHDGRRASLGQVRLDKLQRPIRIDPARPMWLRFSESQYYSCRNVDAIAFETPAQVGPEDFCCRLARDTGLVVLAQAVPAVAGRSVKFGDGAREAIAGDMMIVVTNYEV